MKLRRFWLYRVFDATSQWLNVFLLDGDQHESISGRSHREGWALEGFIDEVLGANHCRDAYFADIARARRYAKETEHIEIPA